MVHLVEGDRLVTHHTVTDCAVCARPATVKTKPLRATASRAQLSSLSLETSRARGARCALRREFSQKSKFHQSSKSSSGYRELKMSQPNSFPSAEASNGMAASGSAPDSTTSGSSKPFVSVTPFLSGSRQPGARELRPSARAASFPAPWGG